MEKFFNICCKTGFVVLNSLSFFFLFACLWIFWFLWQTLTRALLVKSILDCRFFLFITLNILCQSLLACRVSAEKSAVTLWGFPSMLLLLLIFSFCQFDEHVSQCVLPWVNPIWHSALPGLECFFFHVRKVFAIISSDIFPGLFSLSSF